MKIVYTITGMYNSGGMERVLANKANYLSHAKGVDGKSNKVIIITTDQKNRKPFFYLFEDVRCIDLGINYEDDAQLPLPFRLFATKKKESYTPNASKGRIVERKGGHRNFNVRL